MFYESLVDLSDANEERRIGSQDRSDPVTASVSRPSLACEGGEPFPVDGTVYSYATRIELHHRAGCRFPAELTLAEATRGSLDRSGSAGCG